MHGRAGTDGGPPVLRRIPGKSKERREVFRVGVVNRNSARTARKVQQRVRRYRCRLWLEQLADGSRTPESSLPALRQEHKVGPVVVHALVLISDACGKGKVRLPLEAILEVTREVMLDGINHPGLPGHKPGSRRGMVETLGNRVEQASNHVEYRLCPIQVSRTYRARASRATERASAEPVGVAGGILAKKYSWYDRVEEERIRQDLAIFASEPQCVPSLHPGEVVADLPDGGVAALRQVAGGKSRIVQQAPDHARDHARGSELKPSRCREVVEQVEVNWGVLIASAHFVRLVPEEGVQPPGIDFADRRLPATWRLRKDRLDAVQKVRDGGKVCPVINKLDGMVLGELIVSPEGVAVLFVRAGQIESKTADISSVAAAAARVCIRARNKRVVEVHHRRINDRWLSGRLTRRSEIQKVNGDGLTGCYAHGAGWLARGSTSRVIGERSSAGWITQHHAGPAASQRFAEGLVIPEHPKPVFAIEQLREVHWSSGVDSDAILQLERSRDTRCVVKPSVRIQHPGPLKPICRTVKIILPALSDDIHLRSAEAGVHANPAD